MVSCVIGGVYRHCCRANQMSKRSMASGSSWSVTFDGPARSRCSPRAIRNGDRPSAARHRQIGLCIASCPQSSQLMWNITPARISLPKVICRHVWPVGWGTPRLNMFTFRSKLGGRQLADRNGDHGTNRARSVLVARHSDSEGSQGQAHSRPRHTFAADNRETSGPQ